MQKFDERNIALNKLLLDPNNYRFREANDFKEVKEPRFKDESVQAKVGSKLRGQSLTELKNSIIKNGFLPIERIIVRPLKDNPELFVIVEGNRRVAALRWIREDYEAGVEIPESLIETLNDLPVLIIVDDEPNLGLYEAIMGIRHVSGIKQWGGYQRAKLISVMKDEKQYDLTDVAEKLGMTNREVVRRYRAIKALEQMEFDDEYGQFATPALYPLFHEAVSLPALKEWLQWDENNVAFQNSEELRIFYSWITPQEVDENDVPPKISNHREIRELPSILAHPEAISVLKNPEDSFSKASAIANRGEAARAWKAQIAAARDALMSISAEELESMQDEDISAINGLKLTIEKTVNRYKKLTAQ